MNTRSRVLPFPGDRLTKRQKARLDALAQSWHLPPDQILDALLMDACLLRKLHPDFPWERSLSEAEETPA